MPQNATARDVPRPGADEYGPHYTGYVSEVPAGPLLDVLERQTGELDRLAGALDDDAALARYAPGKWSVKEVVGHLADAERIFAYRALRIGRGDPTPLAGFDENPYVEAAGFDRRPTGEILAEFRALRQATLALFASFDAGAWERRGTASGAGVSVRALAHIIAGHAEHHLRILRERYGLGGPRPMAAGDRRVSSPVLGLAVRR